MVKEIRAQELQSAHCDISETTPPERHIAIIGGGPAGISVCQQLVDDLLERKVHSVAISLFEQGDRLGTGLPYSQKEDCYILNLPTRLMEIGNENAPLFSKWWSSHKPLDQTTEFPPRHFFGTYISDLLSHMKVKASQNGITLCYAPRTEVVNIQQSARGGYTIISHHHTYKADHVVLCTGHMPSTTYKALLGTPGYQHDPWGKGAYHDVERTSAVGILGSRLTAIDIAMKLISTDYPGHIHMFSRSGMLPTVLSQEIPAYLLKYLTLHQFNTLTKGGVKPLALEALLDLLWQEISEAQGDSITWDRLVKSADDQSPIDWLRHGIEQADAGPQPWQQVLFTLYPIIPIIWSLLSFSDQKKFLKDYQSVFLTYTAAMPLDNAYRILKLLESGQLQIHGGLTSVTPTSNHFILTTHHQTVHLSRLFNGTGPGYHPGDVPLLCAMQKQGLVQKHHLGGISVDPTTLALIDRSGRRQSGLYAVGELTKGACLTTTDIGQVNRQADKVSYQIGAQVARRSLCHSYSSSPSIPRLFRLPFRGPASCSLQRGLKWASKFIK